MFQTPNTEITEQSAQALPESERRYRALVEHGFEGLTVLDRDENVIYISPANLRILGYDWDDRVGQPAANVLHPDDWNLYRATFDTAVQQPQQVINATWRVRHKDGSWRWVESRFCNLFDHPAVQGMVINWRDITARKEAEDTLRDSERRFRTLVEHAGDGIFLHDADARVLDVNQRACDSLGYSRDELIGMSPLDFDSVITPAMLRDMLRRLDAGESPVFDSYHRRLDRTEFPVEVRLSPFRTNGRLNVIALVHDNSDRKQGESLLKQTVSRLQATLESTADGILVVDREGRTVDFNQRFLQLWKLPPEVVPVARKFGLLELSQRHPLVRQIFEPLCDPDGYLTRVAEIYRTPREPSFDVIRFRDGRVLERYSQPQFSEGEPIGRVWSFRDVTERVRSEETLEINRQRLIESQQIAQMGSWSWEPDTNLAWWSDNTYPLLGVEPSAGPLNYQRFLELVHPDDHEITRERVAMLLDGRADTVDYDFRLVRPDGRTIWLRTVARAVRDANGRVLRLEGIDQDITERKLAEEQHRESQRMISAIAHASPLMMHVFDIVEWRVVYSNRSASETLGYPPVNAQDLSPEFLAQIMHPDDLTSERFTRWETAADGQVFESEYRLKHADGSWRWFLGHDTVFTRDPSGRVRQIVGTAQDVTDRKQLEQQILHAQKMEAIGRLSGGIAHDFNNLLTVINGFSDLLLSQPGLTRAQRDMFTAIRDAGQRANRLTRQLLAFSRQTLVETKTLDINLLVRDAELLLERMIGGAIRLTFDLSSQPLHFRSDAGQFEQVLTNLVVNARDAMPEGGTLAITTRSVAVAQRPPQPPRAFIELEVTDTGCGMAPDVMERIFEPFYTTKRPGSGTGLGLSVVHGVVQQANGSIEVESQPQGGTTFRLRFPLVPPPRPTPALPRSASPPAPATILLVEDDPDVLTFSHHALVEQGYRVLTARHGDEALQQALEFGNRIDLLITDVVMPDLSGREVAERLRAMQPGLPVLYVSGYTHDEVLQHGVRLGFDLFLQKPFSPADLIEKAQIQIDSAD